ncbi:uncharacterized protein EV420DRAFT_1482992 [Desarmillaria tabescens]|uniref:Uncharacterized protein n=1 Tax=Armillaria tabescens TaxID=1929756 RepID=A0AA39JVL6_ARMTA|nr:uncharacterized protein EV420DRAFT_1482992 [Desarmillaria tabescens]KAK0449755.1 hypothetical protein EV420DRAFT_1482992 [Desarmillaria tabescens]
MDTQIIYRFNGIPTSNTDRFSGYETIPSDATEKYTIHSPDLSAGIAAFHGELIPSLQAEVPEITRSSWCSLVKLERTKMEPASRFLHESESHVNRLYQGDHTLRATADDRYSWDKLFFSILARGEVELRDDVDVDTELGIFVWAYMHYMIYYFSLPWLKLQRELRHPERPVSLETLRADALIVPSRFNRNGNSNNQPPNTKFSGNDPSGLMRSSDKGTGTSSFLLRRRKNRAIEYDNADLP